MIIKANYTVKLTPVEFVLVGKILTEEVVKCRFSKEPHFLDVLFKFTWGKFGTKAGLDKLVEERYKDD